MSILISEETVMDLDEISQKLKKLKRRGVDLRVKNRKETVKEDNETARGKKPLIYSMKDDEEVHEQKDGDERDKLLQYTMKDYERWENKQNREGLRSSEGANLRDLAKLTYDKEIRNITKDGPISGGKVTKKIEINSKGKIVLKDEDKLIDKLKDSLDKTADIRYANIRKKIEKRNGTGAGEAFINNKNRQFNEKLTRESKRLQND